MYKIQIADYEDYLAYKGVIKVSESSYKNAKRNRETQILKEVFNDGLFNLVFEIAMQAFELGQVNGTLITNDEMRDNIKELVERGLK